MNWHWLRHDWGKWCEPYWIPWEHTIRLHGVLVGTPTVQQELTQKRTCTTCGKVEYRKP